MSENKYYSLEGHNVSCSVKVGNDDKIVEFVDTTNTIGGGNTATYSTQEYLHDLISEMDWDMPPYGLKSPDEEGCKVTEINEEQFISDKNKFSINNKIREIRNKRSQVRDAQGKDPLAVKKEVLLSDKYAVEKATDDVAPDASDFVPEERIDPTKEEYSKMSKADRQRVHDDHALRRFENLKIYYKEVKGKDI